MIRLGLRMTLNGGRDAAARLVVIVAAVTLGVGLLLTALAGVNAVNRQNDRYAWLETGAAPATSQSSANTGRSAGGPVDPVWWRLDSDFFHGRLIGRVDVAATGPNSPVPPGIARLPGPGEFYASPALGRLLRSTPPDQLGDRYPGRQIGTVGPAALPSPTSLIIIIGHTVADLAHTPGATRVAAVSTTSPAKCNGSCYFIGIDAGGIDLVLSTVAAALLFPVLIFIGVATRLSAARREQRFAAMRLAGATPRQTATISAVETTVATAAGVLLGFGLFFLVRPALAPIPFTGAAFFVGDLSLNLPDVLVVAVGVPVAGAAAARMALRRVNASPLGVSRRATPSPPRAWRLIPLLGGLGELALFVVIGRPPTSGGQILAYLPGILVAMTGLVVAGPWLTMIGSRLMTRHANRPATLIAGRRLSDNPQAGFRAISGLVLALFVSTVAVGTITTINAYDQGPTENRTSRETLVDRFTDYSTVPPSTSLQSVPATVFTTLHAMPAVAAVTVIHGNPADSLSSNNPWGLVSCADLASIVGRCPAGGGVAKVWPELDGDVAGALPTAAVPAAQVNALPVLTVVVQTDGTPAAIERARTALDLALPSAVELSTLAEQTAQDDALTSRYQQLANVVVLAGLAIAGCTLAVSVTAGLGDRKRPFSLLRITGTPLGTLRRVVALESAVPLLILAAVSIGTGFLTAYLFLRSQLHETLQPPGAGYYGAVVAGLVASLAIIASTIPLLERLTGPESARFE